VLVDFWAEWCGPCKMIAPVLEEIADEQAGKVEVVKLNIDDNLDVTRRFDVMSIPTLILFKDASRPCASWGQGQGSASPGTVSPPLSARVAPGGPPRRPVPSHAGGVR